MFEIFTQQSLNNAMIAALIALLIVMIMDLSPKLKKYLAIKKFREAHNQFMRSRLIDDRKKAEKIYTSLQRKNIRVPIELYCEITRRSIPLEIRYSSYFAYLDDAMIQR